MFYQFIFIVFVTTIQRPIHAIWQCGADIDCLGLPNSVCQDGVCGCTIGQQTVLGGSLCADVAPYYYSPCYESFQCSRLFPGHQCSFSDDSDTGSCNCLPNNFYFNGRCWSTKLYGEVCSTNEECMGILKDPFSMTCMENECVCADGYYLRQRGECRKAGLAIGDGCVLDADCQFPNGACDQNTFTCFDITAPESTKQIQITTKIQEEYISRPITRTHNIPCNTMTSCPTPMECMQQGYCICPIGYYLATDSNGQISCLAELGSPATEDICKGLFAIVKDGLCTCPSNFYYNTNMRDCVKATLRITDSCISDAMCHTFGSAATCAPPTEPWGTRQCVCDSNIAVWDSGLNLCRLFVGIGEVCQADSDCLAGNVEILCRPNSVGEMRCTCPEGLEAVDGLCLTAGLGLGDQCQVTQECMSVANSDCVQGLCSCAGGYQEDNGLCAPEIGGTCIADVDCVIENTVCESIANTSTCQCKQGFIEHDSTCWAVQSTYGGDCTVTAQCAVGMGDGAECVNEQCICAVTHHYRDGCWPKVDLFGTCSRSIECYLGDITDRVVCRNGLCQCDFQYPYDEVDRTCSSSPTRLLGSIILTIFAISALFNI